MPINVKIGDNITIKSCPVLGNDPEPTKVIAVESFGYYVKDSTGWVGPVDFEFYPLQCF